MKILLAILNTIFLLSIFSCSASNSTRQPNRHTDQHGYNMSAPNGQYTVEDLGTLPNNGSMTVTMKLIDYDKKQQKWSPSAYLSLYNKDQTNSFRTVLIDQGNEFGQFAAYEYLKNGEYQLKKWVKKNIPLNTPVKFHISWDTSGVITIRVDDGKPIITETSLSKLRYMTSASGVTASFSFNE